MTQPIDFVLLSPMVFCSPAAILSSGSLTAPMSLLDKSMSFPDKIAFGVKNPEEAIHCGTVNGAYASFEENLKGSIEPGKLADLLVLGQDPFKADPSSLIKVPVERTMVGGKWVYES